MSDNGKKIKWKDKENILLRRVIMNTMGNSKMGIKKEKVFSNLLTENLMKEIIKTIKKKDMGFINSKIMMNMMDNGKTIKNMEKGNTRWQMVKVSIISNIYVVKRNTLK